MKFTRLHINALTIAICLIVAGTYALVLGYDSVASGTFGVAGGVALKFSDLKDGD